MSKDNETPKQLEIWDSFKVYEFSKKSKDFATVRDVFAAYDRVWTREELATVLGVSDRKVREQIQEARRDGVPIMALPEGGYKIAKTYEEKKQLLHAHRGRALDLLKTYSRLKRAMFLENQFIMNERR